MEPSSGRYADREVQEGRGAGGRHSLRGGRAVPADLAGARPERPQPRDHGGCAGRGLEARHLADRVGAVVEPFAAGIVSPIIGPKSVKQLEDNLAALDVTLPAETVERIDAASEPRYPYPHDFLRMARQMTAQMQAQARD